MAGHSKWANIQHRKKAQDNKRGKLFTKHIRAITVAARAGGGDISANPRLRLEVDKALAVNMTRDTIDRAIKRGAGSEDGADMMETRYEGYGTNGVAIMVDCLTDNKNRTVAEVRHAFSKYNGNLGTEGSVSYLFSKQGQLNFAPGVNEEALFDAALESGAEDVMVDEDGSACVITTVDAFSSVKDALQQVNLTPDHAEITMVASTEVSLDAESSEKLMKLIDALEDLDDVQEVFSNAELANTVS